MSFLRQNPSVDDLPSISSGPWSPAPTPSPLGGSNRKDFRSPKGTRSSGSTSSSKKKSSTQTFGSPTNGLKINPSPRLSPAVGGDDSPSSPPVPISVSIEEAKAKGSPMNVSPSMNVRGTGEQIYVPLDDDADEDAILRKMEELNIGDESLLVPIEVGIDGKAKPKKGRRACVDTKEHLRRKRSQKLNAVKNPYLEYQRLVKEIVGFKAGGTKTVKGFPYKISQCWSMWYQYAIWSVRQEDMKRQENDPLITPMLPDGVITAQNLGYLLEPHRLPKNKEDFLRGKPVFLPGTASRKALEGKMGWKVNRENRGTASKQKLQASRSTGDGPDSDSDSEIESDDEGGNGENGRETKVTQQQKEKKDKKTKKISKDIKTILQGMMPLDEREQLFSKAIIADAKKKKIDPTKLLIKGQIEARKSDNLDKYSRAWVYLDSLFLDLHTLAKRYGSDIKFLKVKAAFEYLFAHRQEDVDDLGSNKLPHPRTWVQP